MKILKFSASWCGPCKALSEVLEGVDLGVEVENVDVDHDKELAEKYRVRGVPTMILIDDDGSVKKVLSGAHSLVVIKDWVSTP